MRIVVVTGLSGSGKSTALKALEDAGFYTIDNLPLTLLDQLLNVLDGERTSNLALGVDARTASIGESTSDLPKIDPMSQALQDATDAGHEVDLLFLDSTDEMLTRRFSETRRKHPLSMEGSVTAGITRERKILAPLRDMASRVIETSQLSVHDLKKEVQRVFSEADTGIEITLESFGFKNGVPIAADLVLDVRFLPNPYFDTTLRPQTGKDEPVANFVLRRAPARAFLRHLEALLTFLLPEYKKEGKTYLTISIGCTGGQHRSVAMVEEISKRLSDLGWNSKIRHRDLPKDAS